MISVNNFPFYCLYWCTLPEKLSYWYGNKCLINDAKQGQVCFHNLCCSRHFLFCSCTQTATVYLGKVKSVSEARELFPSFNKSFQLSCDVINKWGNWPTLSGLIWYGRVGEQGEEKNCLNIISGIGLWPRSLVPFLNKIKCIASHAYQCSWYGPWPPSLFIQASCT